MTNSLILYSCPCSVILTELNGSLAATITFSFSFLISPINMPILVMEFYRLICKKYDSSRLKIFINEKFKLFFTSILPDYLAHDITREFWKYDGCFSPQVSKLTSVWNKHKLSLKYWFMEAKIVFCICPLVSIMWLNLYCCLAVWCKLKKGLKTPKRHF